MGRCGAALCRVAGGGGADGSGAGERRAGGRVGGAAMGRVRES